MTSLMISFNNLMVLVIGYSQLSRYKYIYIAVFLLQTLNFFFLRFKISRYIFIYILAKFYNFSLELYTQLIILNDYYIK